ncbi:unnamed protein product [Zymoseptoria tritici ST99CH_3D7]|uniref:N-acetyltransferase domain-containing protein n=1 Tax=Zymoseptoria tritici (strain ST99CH_3D7) TaxID=1276538 RepID=A0A1X7S469_ZYMT9|nr:unnamed protein product [Zymoseptoria tritici ST99CH_3D7]
MGNTTSRVQNQLSQILPQPHGPDNARPFSDHEDREQFIHALLSLLRQCNLLNFDALTVKLLYSRRTDDRLVATLIVVDSVQDKIRAKVEPSEDGKDQAEAFLAFRRYVEVRLYELLQSVPEAGGGGKVQSAATGNGANVPVESPPSYDAAKDGTGGGAKTVPTSPANRPDSSLPLVGTFTTLTGIQESHIPSLWHHLHLQEHPTLMQYLPWPIPTSPSSLSTLLTHLITDRHFVLYAILADPSHVSLRPASPSPWPHPSCVGIIAYLDINTTHRTLEVGAVIFAPVLQRSIAATEAHYLLLRNAFSAELGYRRVAYKCATENVASRRAAERLGYVYEGRFRNHMIMHGVSRDSDWLSVVEEEWEGVRGALEEWLREGNFDEGGRQVRKLEEIRRERLGREG